MSARRQRFAAGLLVAALAGAGCSITEQSLGRNPPDASALTVGVTTKAQALAVLGPPLSVRRQADGDLFLYRRDALRSERLLLVPLLPVYERTTGWERSDLLALLFDARGVLAGVGEQRDL